MRSLSPRQKFIKWLRTLGDERRRQPLSVLRLAYAGEISFGSAYRSAVEIGLLGRRTNTSRYDAFWAQVDWRLPDRVLARVWRLDRSNVRARRLRLGLDRPRWRSSYDFRMPSFVTALRAEESKADMFTGLRPDPARRETHARQAVMR